MTISRALGDLRDKPSRSGLLNRDAVGIIGSHRSVWLARAAVCVDSGDVNGSGRGNGGGKGQLGLVKMPCS